MVRLESSFLSSTTTGSVILDEVVSVDLAGSEAVLIVLPPNETAPVGGLNIGSAACVFFGSAESTVLPPNVAGLVGGWKTG